MLWMAGGVQGQGVLTTITPNSATPGQTVNILLRGQGTQFSQSSQINMGAGVTIDNIQTVSPEVLTYRAILDAGISLGVRDIQVTNGPDQLTLPMSFTVFGMGTQIMANLTVLPLTTLNLSDIDPNNMANSPILFYVNIFNDQQTRNNLNAKLTLSGQRYGNIAFAEKTIASLAGMATLQFSSKQFDKYQIASTDNADFFTDAVRSGSLPADVYTYLVEIKDANGQLIVSAEGKNTITNQITRPELINPGASLNNGPGEVRNPNPVFSWFSQGQDFDLFLYPVNPGQTTPQEIALNRPVFEQRGIITNTLPYPAGAEILLDGKLYAWQVVLHVPAGTNTNLLYSDMNWFVYRSSSLSTPTIFSIKINPEEVFVTPGNSYKFNVKGYGAQGEPIDDVNASYRVIPSEGGTITPDGNFTAGPKSGPVAVVAQYGEHQVYSTVTIAPIEFTDWNMKRFLEQLFGLPTN